jgi:hypothetical protein
MSSIRKSESGQVMVLATAAILIILGFAAMAVDVGSFYAARRNMQTAADAAAIAGSNALKQKCGTNADCTCENQTACKSAGQDVASLNGYTDGTNSVTVTVKSPAAAPSPTNGVYVEADVTQPVPTFFLRALGYNSMNVSTSAVAGYDTPPNCMITLDPTAANSFVASGGSSVSANCGLVVDSSSTSGLVDSGGSTITAGSVGVAATSETQASSGVTPPYVPSVAPVADPLSTLAPPPQCSTSGGCSGVKCDFTNFHPGSSTSTTAGVYCGGITVSGGNSLTLGPGTYILVGGGLSVSGGSSSLSGTGVTFYNTYNASNAYKAIALTGGSATTLSAPTSGPMNGILFFQDRNGPAGTSFKNTVSASGGTFTGAIYFPTQNLTFSGGTSVSTPNNVSLIADTITFSGGKTTYLGAGASGPGQTPPITTSRLYQ